MPLAVGSTVWIFDANRRVYERGSGVTAHPIYREHFAEMKIVGENSKSWLLEHGLKVDKETKLLRPPGGGGYFGKRPTVYETIEAVEDECYVKASRGRLSREVLACHDAATLRKVESLFTHILGDV